MCVVCYVCSASESHLDWTNEYSHRFASLSMGLSGGNTSITTAAEHGHHQYILEWIRTRPASIDERGGSLGCSALGYAIIRRDLQLVKFLLSQSASVNVINNNGGIYMRRIWQAHL